MTFAGGHNQAEVCSATMPRIVWIRVIMNIILADGTVIPAENVFGIEGEIFGMAKEDFSIGNE